MKAIRIHFTDTGDELRMDDAPTPVPESGQLLVRAQAIGLNRADLYRRRTAPEGEPEPPRIPGLDVAGVVESVGADVTGWSPGDQVMALVRGAYAEYSVADSALAYRPPAGKSMTDAASLPCVFLTAWYAFQMAGLKVGETALIHAAGSGVGMAGIQIAKALGAMTLTSAGWEALAASGGQIVLISSITAVQACEGNAAYAASKGGLNALGEVLRLEGRDQGIRVITVCPAQTDTELWQHKAPESVRARMMPADGVGELVASLMGTDRRIDIGPVVIRPVRAPWAETEP